MNADALIRTQKWTTSRVLTLLLSASVPQVLQDAQASEGQVVVLECRVRGSPPLRVQWYRQGEELQDSPDFRILQKSEFGSPQ